MEMIKPRENIKKLSKMMILLTRIESNYKTAASANRRVTKGTHIRFYTECGTGQTNTQPEPTKESPRAHTFAFTQNAAQGKPTHSQSQQKSHQVHTHSLLHRMRHKAIKPASKSAAKALRNPKIEKPQAKILVNLYKV
jgi:hypothetical protein